MHKVQIKGSIVSNNDKWIYDWFEMDATCPRDVMNVIEQANGQDLELEINSGGGSVFAGSEIYTMLKDYKGKVTGKIVGVAASAASVIAMAAEILKISPPAQIMIHNVSNGAWGDYREMQKNSDFLKNYNKSIANAYILKTNMAQEDLLDLMNKETWLNAQQAKELGFADEIMFDDNNQLVASINTAMLPEEVISKIRNFISKPTDILSFNLGLENKIENIKKVEGSVVTIEEIKNNHPELYNQILNEGKNSGINEERERIKAIENLALPGNEEILNKAKFDTGLSPEATAIQIIQAEKIKGSTFLNNRLEDVNASNVNDVAGAPAPINSKETVKKEEDEAAEEIANVANRRRGIK